MSMDPKGPPILTGGFDAAAEAAPDLMPGGANFSRGRILDVTRYRLTTAEILYHLPDHPRLLQTFVWQEMDMAPRFPVLHKFLQFWQRELDGKLHRVRVAHAGIAGPAGSRFVDLQVALH